MAASPNRVAAHQANARKSTGPKSPEGKARSSQNARKHPFNPDPFAIVRIEDRAAISTLVADAIATYQPINSQERDAVERIALAKHSMRRMSVLEAGFFTNCLDQAPPIHSSSIAQNSPTASTSPSNSTAPTGSPSASIASPGNPISPPRSFDFRPRPSASIAAPSKISIAS